MLREQLGLALGWIGAPLFALASAARRARTFHPDGIVLRATVDVVSARDAMLAALATRLAGPAIVRFSGALWKRPGERVDVLGCAVRFRSTRDASARPDEGDQDLLFATIRSPWTMTLAPFATRVHDFLDNSYFATAPFDVPGVGRAMWRLVPERKSPPGEDRYARLLAAVAEARGVLRLQVRRTWTMKYADVARIVLEAVVDVDQEALRFDPFRSGRGIHPRGLVHALRRGAYSASQKTRPARQG